ncbi:putative D-methionine transport system permease protein metI, partial [Lacticaseibacillus paracasei subsp. paracasei CNCM I-4649]
MGQFFTKYFPNVVPIWSGDGGVTQAINETLYMTVLTAVVAGILGIVIGILLVLTDE